MLLLLTHSTVKQPQVPRLEHHSLQPIANYTDYRINRWLRALPEISPKSLGWLKINVTSQQTFPLFKRTPDDESCIDLLSNISSSDSSWIEFVLCLSALLLSLSRHPLWMTWIIKHSRMIVYLVLAAIYANKGMILYAPHHFKMIACRVNKLRLNTRFTDDKPYES